MLTVCELFQTFPCVYLIKWNNCIKGYDQSLRVFIRIVTFKAFYKNCHIGFQKCYMDRGAWWAAVHGVTKSRTWLKRPSRHTYIGDSDKEFACQWRRCRKCGFALWSGRFPGGGNGNPLQYSCLENPVAKEPGRLQSMRSQSETRLSMHTHNT